MKERDFMSNVIIGTAGHIDHGKTTLIKALSGIETDTMTEEKERGISINLGFAYTKSFFLTFRTLHKTDNIFIFYLYWISICLMIFFAKG